MTARWQGGLRRVVRLVALGAIGALVPLADARSEDNPCPAPLAYKLFIVDGITGTTKECLTARPLKVGDSVVVRVIRANPLHFHFAVATDSSVALVRGYGVIGEGTRLGTGQVHEASYGVTSIDLGRWNTFAVRPLTPPDSVEPTPRQRLLASLNARMLIMLESLYRLDSQHMSALRSVAEATQKVVAQDEDLVGGHWQAGFNAVPWPDDYDNAARNFNASKPGLKNTISSFREAWGVTLQLSTELRLMVARYNALDLAAGEVPVTLGDFGRLYDSVLVGMRASLDKAEVELDSASARVDRWTQVKAMTPSPMLQATFHVVRSNTRVHLTVTRRPTSKAALAALAQPPKADQPAPEVVLARLRYESHGEARFAMTVGFAALYRPRSSTYAIAPRLADDGTLEQTVVRSASDKAAVQPIIQFMVFDKAVDDLNLAGPSKRYGVVIGAELSVPSARGYFLGVAMDHRAGFQVALGATLYLSTELNNGWEEGDVVPLKDDGSPRVSPVPTTQSRRHGYFAALTFRPVILHTLLKAIGLANIPGG